MIKANELRIGNILQAAEDEFKDTPPFAISIGDIRIIHEGQITHKYRQVPLSEDWLVRFGEKDYISGYNLILPNKSIIHIECCEKNFLFSIDNNDGTNSSAFMRAISFVHEAQNLYFALVGEELTLKE